VGQASSTSIVTESVVGFLKTMPPFQFLQPSELAALSEGMTLEYFPRNTVILRAGDRAAESLYIIQKGGVKLALRSGIGKELTLDIRSEGEVFGVLSLMGRDVARLDVIAVEDTICYAIPAARMKEFLSSHQEIADFFLRTSLTRYMDRSLHELRERTRLMGDSERLLYTLPVRDLATNPPVLTSETTSIGQAARLVSAAGATCLFAVNAEGRAVGIVTDKNFTEAVASEVSPDLPVSTIVSTPVIAVESSQPVFQALLTMLGKGIHHVLVTEDGVPKSVLTSHDLLLLQGKSPVHVAHHLQQQKTLAGLVEAHRRVRDLVPLLIREGARASHITRVVAEMNDRLISRILELGEAELGRAPMPYCWVVLGSEGRSEQTFTTDQDNGLIYAEPGAEHYFARLAAYAHDALARCGYPDCKGGYMAANPQWRQPLDGWCAQFRDWMAGAELRAVQNALIFFDMRPVHGAFSLFHALEAHNRGLLQSAVFFKSVLAYASLEHKPPLGLFRTLVLERTGQHKDQLDLKLSGTGPIVNAARVFALDAGLPHVNTVERLVQLQLRSADETPIFREAGEAFEFLTLLRLESQLQQARAGRPIGNHIGPGSLTHLQRSLLKEAFQSTVRLQSLLESKFRSAVWAQLQAR